MFKSSAPFITSLSLPIREWVIYCISVTFKGPRPCNYKLWWSSRSLWIYSSNFKSPETRSHVFVSLEWDFFLGPLPWSTTNRSDKHRLYNTVFHVFNHRQVRRGVFCWLHAAECHEILQFWSQTEGVWKIMAHYKMLWRFLGQKGAMHYIMWSRG